MPEGGAGSARVRLEVWARCRCVSDTVHEPPPVGLAVGGFAGWCWVGRASIRLWSGLPDSASLTEIFMSEDIQAEALAELRKIKRAFYLALLLLFIGTLLAIYGGSTHGFAADDSWASVRTAMDRDDFTTALAMARRLVARQPDYYYGHVCLGAVYLAVGDAASSEAQYERACQLFPSEEDAKLLAAVRTRLSSGAGFKLPSTMSWSNLTQEPPAAAP